MRWADSDLIPGADDGLSVDDFSLTPSGPPPALPTLTVNGVTLVEGNTGTTTFGFTVALNKPAGADGVTFDITTADGTAIANGDYVATSLTGQTIPGRSLDATPSTCRSTATPPSKTTRRSSSR